MLFCPEISTFYIDKTHGASDDDGVKIVKPNRNGGNGALNSSDGAQSVGATRTVIVSVLIVELSMMFSTLISG